MFARKNFGRASQVGAFLVAGLIALWTTESAMASEIVDLRIGSHPEFTRIVFELDRPTGYRIERASPSPGVSELVVSIDATSIPRKVQNKDALIGLVTITPRGKGSSAEIRLAREGLRLKEMILSSPPRIVLDILASPVAKKASSAPPAMAKKKAVKKKPVAKPVVKPKSQSKPQPTRMVSVPAPKAKTPPTPKKPVVVRTVPSAKPIPAVKLAKPRRAKTVESVKRLVVKDPEEPMGRGLAVLELEADEVVRIVPPSPNPERVLEQFKAPTEEEESGNGTLWAALLGVVVLGAILVARRRGRAPRDGDDLDEGVEVGGPPPETGNPFATRSPMVEKDPFAAETDSHVQAVPDIELDLGELDDEGEKEEAPVDSHLFSSNSSLEDETDLTSQGFVGQPQQQGSEETYRLLEDFERRAEGLERRLEEASEARERLERQVAAQTEELRVQRAAIARTQRAVRNMNRPDDQPPTEPTPRES
jgi:hypothetical protein